MKLTRVLVRRGRVHHSKHGRVHQLGASLHLHKKNHDGEIYSKASGFDYHHHGHGGSIVVEHPAQRSNVEHLRSALKHLAVSNVPKPKPKKYISVKF
jgi:hypothetical protein